MQAKRENACKKCLHIFYNKKEGDVIKRPLTFLFFLTILFSIFSFIQDEPPVIDTSFQEEGQITLSGTIYQIVEKEKSTAIYLDQILISSLNQKNLQEQSYGVNRILLYYTGEENLQVKNRIFVSGTIQKFTKGTNPGQFNEYLYYKSNGIDYKIFGENVKIEQADSSVYHQILKRIRDTISQVYKTVLSEEDAGVLCAMVLGEKTALPQDTKELYQKNGMAHILAISGLHISIIGMCLFRFLKKCYCPNEMAIPVSIFVLVSYGILTGASVSTNRAVVMFVVSMVGILIGRTYDFISAICLSGILILLQNPLQIVNSGFLLSFGAVFAIAYVFPIVKLIVFGEDVEGVELEKTTNRLNMKFLFWKPKEIKRIGESDWAKQKRKWLKGIAESFLVSFSINLVTLPIILYFYFDMPLYSLIINLLLLPLVSLLLGLGIILGVAGSIYLPAGYFLAGSVHVILIFYDKMCHFFLQLPFSVLTIGRPGVWQILLYYVVLILFLVSYFYFKNDILLILCIGLFCIFLKPVRNGVEITMMDVGQGDGILIESETGKNYYIDGGSTTVNAVGKYRIVPCLKSKGIATLDYLILTHMDQDHISGATEMLETCKEPGNIKIKNLLLPDTACKDEAYQSMVELAKKQNVSVMYLKKGDKLIDGMLSMNCLHPVSGFKTEDRNDYSTVLLLNYKNFDMLFTGDVSNEGEQAVIDNPELTQCDVLKAAHHGSKYTNSEELLSIVKPAYTIISAAEDNDYGHPHKEVLERLTACGSEYFCTMDYGAIEIKSDGDAIVFDFYKKE